MKKIITLLMLCYCFSMNAQTAIANKGELTSLIDDWIADPSDVKFTDNTNDPYYGLIGDWNVSAVTDMSSAFANKATFNANISGWDVSNVTNMNSMFLKAIDFDQDISSWVVSNVTDMTKMFKGDAGNNNFCKFNQDISGWNVGKVESFFAMFNEANLFNQDISGWDVSSATNMRQMFRKAAAFNQDIGSWNLSKVTNTQAMFWDATAFNQDISSWDVSKVTQMHQMFQGATAFNQDISAWDVSSVSTMKTMFKGATSFNQDLSSWDVSNVIINGSGKNLMEEMFNGATAFTQDLSSWCVTNLVTLPPNFATDSNITNLPVWGTCTATWTGATNNDWDTATNWDTPKVPDANRDITIPSGLTNYPTATTALTVNSLTLASGASFITSSAVTGDVTSKRNLSVADKWYLVSSPVSGEIMTDMRTNNSFADNGTKVSFAPYDNSQADSNNRWAYFSNTATDALVDGKGYSTKLTAAGDVSFTGSLNTSNITDISLTDNSTASGNALNLIGNPFAAYVNLSSLLTANDAGGNDLLTESSVWIWNQATNTYDAYNSGSSFEIAPNQAFFVSADGNSSTFTITTAMLSHQATSTFQRSSGKGEIKLFVNNGKSTRETKVYYLDNVSAGFDNGYDSSVFSGEENSFELSTALVSNNEGKKLAIQSLPNSDLEAMVVPVGLKAAAGKEITFSAEAMNLPDGIKVFLEDRNTNTFTILDEANATYKITLTEALDGIGRFYIHTIQSALSIDNLSLNGVSIYKTNASTLRVTGLQQGKASLSLFNVLGKQVISTSFEANGNKDIYLPKLAAGVYFAKVQTATGKLSKKIILE